jgi:hypothetical protein
VAAVTVTVGKVLVMIQLKPQSEVDLILFLSITSKQSAVQGSAVQYSKVQCNTLQSGVWKGTTMIVAVAVAVVEYCEQLVLLLCFALLCFALLCFALLCFACALLCLFACFIGFNCKLIKWINRF